MNSKFHTEKNILIHKKTELVKYIRRFILLEPYVLQKCLKSFYFAYINSKIELIRIRNMRGTYLIAFKPIIVLQKHFIRTINIKVKPSAPIFRILNVSPTNVSQRLSRFKILFLQNEKLLCILITNIIRLGYPSTLMLILSHDQTKSQECLALFKVLILVRLVCL